MAHNTLVRPGGWSNGTPLQPTELPALEAGLAAGIDGDAGGCCAPASAIVIGGNGIQIRGLLRITRLGTLTSGAALAFQLNDGDYEQLDASHAGRTRRVRFVCARARGNPRYGWRVRREDAALQALAPALDLSDGSGPQVARAFLGIRAHDGSTITSVTLTLRVGYPHTTLPTTMPSARLLRVDADGNAVAMTSTAAGADALGYVAITKPSSGAAWYAGGAVQTLTIAADQNNVVDLSSYDYVLELVEEQGLTGFPWVLVFKPTVRIATTANVNLGALPATIDGVTWAEGDRVLLKDQTDPTQNGIYLAHASGFLRAPDLDSSADFSRGFCVRVDQGNTNRASAWQCVPSITSWTPGSLPRCLPTWASATAYALNAYVQPSAAHATGFYYQATAIAGTGTSGGTEPAWPTVIGQTVIDNAGGNQITWTCAGAIASELAFVTRPDVANAPDNGTSMLPRGVVWHSALVTFSNISDLRPQ